MTAAAPRRRGRRTPRILAALTAALHTVVATLAGAAAATAAPVGYVGTTPDTTAFDANGGDRVLDLMTAGESYSSSLTGPQYLPGMEWCWSVDEGSLPTGITMSPDGGCAATATFTGTPEVGDYDFVIRVADTSDGPTYYLTFHVVVESGKSPTTTTLSAPVVAPHGGIQLSATVAGNPVVTGAPTGSVEFRDQDGALLQTGTLSGGLATVTASIDRSRIGVDLEVTAYYLGDDDYEASTSDESDIVVYAPTLSGAVQWNGTPVTDATVRLVRALDSGTTDTAATDADGEFELDPGAIATIPDAERTYLIEISFADGEVLYYAPGEINVSDLIDAEATTPLDWTASVLIERETGPRWVDDGLRTPRVGSVYSDTVSASSRGPVTFTVTSGDLPSGLVLDPATGAVTGTPDACSPSQPQTPFPFFARGMASCDYDFTITIDNGYGSSDERFTGTLLPAGVAPTWEDDDLGEFREGVAVDEAVLAAGDPTIVYTVTDGDLPSGLTLSAGGVLTGTPAIAGAYAFTITAANDYGSITAVFEGEIAAKPELDLELEFEAGTSIEDAASTISADGLQVGSTYTLTMFSTPRVLYTGTVDASGGFTWVVSLPADTPPGAHRLVLTGIAADGTPMSAQAWFTLGSNGTILATSYAGPTADLVVIAAPRVGLAATGADVGTTVLAGALLLLLGAGALTISRRRSAV